MIISKLITPLIRLLLSGPNLQKIPEKDVILTNRFLLKSSADHMTVYRHLHVNCIMNERIAKFVHILQIS
jgi:hypothetical protein